MGLEREVVFPTSSWTTAYSHTFSKHCGNQCADCHPNSTQISLTLYNFDNASMIADNPSTPYNMVTIIITIITTYSLIAIICQIFRDIEVELIRDRE